MDSLVVLCINLGVGLIAGIAHGIKNYKDKKKRKKLEKQLKELKEKVDDTFGNNEPIETPSEAGYHQPASYHDQVS